MAEPLVLPPSEAALRAACSMLRAGGLVAVPTETVYGLAADARNAAAVRGIFAAKERPAGHPLILHVATIAQAKALCASWPAEADALAAAFWPGPLTLVLPRAACVLDEVTGGGDTVAIRVPAHPLALELLRAYGAPLAAPSANLHEQLSPTCAGHVVDGLGDRVDLVLDGGATQAGIESSIVDLSPLARGEAPKLLRPGPLGGEALRAHVPSLQSEQPQQVDVSSVHSAPGRARRHYAPRVPLELLPRERLHERLAHEQGVAWLALRAEGLAGPGEALGVAAAGYAAQLFAALHRLERSGAARILVEEVPETPEWAAVRDRLWRAAAPASSPAPEAATPRGAGARSKPRKRRR